MLGDLLEDELLARTSVGSSLRRRRDEEEVIESVGYGPLSSGLRNCTPEQFRRWYTMGQSRNGDPDAPIMQCLLQVDDKGTAEPCNKTAVDEWGLCRIFRSSRQVQPAQNISEQDDASLMTFLDQQGTMQGSLGGCMRRRVRPRTIDSIEDSMLADSMPSTVQSACMEGSLKPSMQNTCIEDSVLQTHAWSDSCSEQTTFGGGSSASGGTDSPHLDSNSCLAVCVELTVPCSPPHSASCWLTETEDTEAQADDGAAATVTIQSNTTEQAAAADATGPPHRSSTAATALINRAAAAVRRHRALTTASPRAAVRVQRRRQQSSSNPSSLGRPAMDNLGADGETTLLNGIPVVTAVDGKAAVAAVDAASTSAGLPGMAGASTCSKLAAHIPTPSAIQVDATAAANGCSDDAQRGAAVEEQLQVNSVHQESVHQESVHQDALAATKTTTADAGACTAAQSTMAPEVAGAVTEQAHATLDQAVQQLLSALDTATCCTAEECHMSDALQADAAQAAECNVVVGMSVVHAAPAALNGIAAGSAGEVSGFAEEQAAESEVGQGETIDAALGKHSDAEYAGTNTHAAEGEETVAQLLKVAAVPGGIGQFMVETAAQLGLDLPEAALLRATAEAPEVAEADSHITAEAMAGLRLALDQVEKAETGSSFAKGQQVHAATAPPVGVWLELASESQRHASSAAVAEASLVAGGGCAAARQEEGAEYLAAGVHLLSSCCALGGVIELPADPHMPEESSGALISKAGAAAGAKAVAMDKGMSSEEAAELPADLHMPEESTAALISGAGAGAEAAAMDQGMARERASEPPSDPHMPEESTDALITKAGVGAEAGVMDQGMASERAAGSCPQCEQVLADQALVAAHPAVSGYEAVGGAAVELCESVSDDADAGFVGGEERDPVVAAGLVADAAGNAGNMDPVAAGAGDMPESEFGGVADSLIPNAATEARIAAIGVDPTAVAESFQDAPACAADKSSDGAAALPPSAAATHMSAGSDPAVSQAGVLEVMPLYQKPQLQQEQFTPQNSQPQHGLPLSGDHQLVKSITDSCDEARCRLVPGPRKRHNVTMRAQAAEAVAGEAAAIEAISGCVVKAGVGKQHHTRACVAMLLAVAAVVLAMLLYLPQH